MAPPIDVITIYRPDVFDCFRLGSTGRLKGDAPPSHWFATCIAGQYSDIAERHGCAIEFSAMRLEEARLAWMHDAGRLDGDTAADHFRHAGFLVYWLRSRSVVNLARRARDVLDVGEQDQFLLSPNEILAFILGLRLCMYFESKHLADDRDHIGHELQRRTFDSQLKFDIAALLKREMVSPHALYLTFRALFYTLERPPRSAPILKFPGRIQ